MKNGYSSIIADFLKYRELIEVLASCAHLSCGIEG
jgi:hypothetical protein